MNKHQEAPEQDPTREVSASSLAPVDASHTGPDGIDEGVSDTSPAEGRVAAAHAAGADAGAFAVLDSAPSGAASEQERAEAEKAYRRTKRGAQALLIAGWVSVLAFFFWLSYTGIQQGRPGNPMPYAGRFPYIAGIGGALLASFIALYLALNRESLVERKALGAARRARLRFREREDVLYARRTREA